MKHKKMKRRNFIKAGFGTTGLGIFCFKQFFSPSSPDIKPNNNLSSTGKEEQMEIFRKYGGEFFRSEIKIREG